MPTEALNLDKIETPTGYATHDTYFARRFTQGGHQFYSIDLAVPELVGILPRPARNVSCR